MVGRHFNLLESCPICVPRQIIVTVGPIYIVFVEEAIQTALTDADLYCWFTTGLGRCVPPWLFLCNRWCIHGFVYSLIISRILLLPDLDVEQAAVGDSTRL